MKKPNTADRNSSDGKETNQTSVKGLRWSWIYGAIGGAAVVGAVWIGVSTTHQTDPVTAKVGNTAIRHSQLTSKLEAASGSTMLEEMIADQLITDGAKKYNLTASKQDLAKAQQSIESQYGITSSAQLSALLAQNNMTQSAFNEMLKVQVLEQKLAERGITVTNQEIQSYYNSHKSSFTPSGSKTPQPLSAVKTQIVDAIKQSKATPSAQLLAQLAKQDPITIYDKQYDSVKTQLESPAPTSGTSAGSAGTVPSGTTGTTSSGSTGNATSANNTAK